MNSAGFCYIINPTIPSEFTEVSRHIADFTKEEKTENHWKWSDGRVQFCLAACTDRGKTRRVNQDGLLLQQAVCGRKRYVLAAVCDGLGGL